MKIINSTVLAPILIVEDEEDHARLITRSLIDSGNIANELIHLKNGEEAMNYLKKEEEYKDDENIPPSLILLDVKMPMKNGFEVLEELKKDQNLKKIPVVMLTTTSTSEDINKAMSLGANDYIVKPVKFADFTSKVQKLGYYWGIVSDSGKINT
jgi:two-component system, response regulator